jgi:hypothetical protein
MHAIGIIELYIENSKIVDNIFLQLLVYPDEIFHAFKNHELYSKY